MGQPESSSIQLRPIADADLGRVARFLHTHHGSDVSPERWLSALEVPWPVEAPNRGFMLLDGGSIVGVYVAYYSEQLVAGRPERFCNLGSWYVLPEHRLHSLRLLRALLAQEGYHFTDVTPVNEVAAIDVRLGFEPLDTDSVVVPGLPLRLPSRRGTITSDPERIERILEGSELNLYRDHARAPGALHAVVQDGERSCYVVARRDRWKGLPVLRLLHVSDRALYRRFARRLGRHQLARARAVALIVERRVVEYEPRLALRLRTPKPRLFRSERLGPDEISYLYTEMVCLSW